jgi:hypothetical protein
MYALEDPVECRPGVCPSSNWGVDLLHWVYGMKDLKSMAALLRHCSGVDNYLVRVVALADSLVNRRLVHEDVCMGLDLPDSNSGTEGARILMQYFHVSAEP